MAKTYLKPIQLPEGVSISCESNTISVAGKLGELSLTIHEDVSILKEDSSISFSPKNVFSCALSR